MEMIPNNNRYRIKGTGGWQNFAGFRTNHVSEIIEVVADVSTIKCTPEHKFLLVDGTFKTAGDISAGDIVSYTRGEAVIKSVKRHTGSFKVYDPIEVENGNVYRSNGFYSHNCSFVGSQRTLIAGATLKNMSHLTPIQNIDGLKQYKKPEKDRQYAITVDTGAGKGLDHSCFSIFDVTAMPYEQVCIFRSNQLITSDYAAIVFNMATFYNNAMMLIETNNMGIQVADIMHLDYGYEEMLFTESGKKGVKISGGFGTGKIEKGLYTTVSTKAIGCSILKMLIEQQMLLIHDETTIDELKQFVKVGKSYQADTGFHDDTVMTLVIFAWLANQSYFSDLTDNNTMNALRDLSDSEIEENMIPFGFMGNMEEVEEAMAMKEMFGSPTNSKLSYN